MLSNCKRVLLFGLGLALLACSLHAFASPDPVVMETRHVRYLIGADGKNAGLIDKQTGKDYLAAPAWPFATIKLSGKEFAATSCTFENDELFLSFQAARVTVAVKVLSRESYWVFEVESVSDPAVDELALINLAATSTQYRSGISGLVGDDVFSVALRALDLKTNARIGGTPAMLTAVFTRKAGLAGAKAALVASPTSVMRPALQEVIRKEGLSESPLGGPWALDAPENRGSYVFADVSEANVEQWIALAKQAGLAQVHFIGWERAYGHYPPRPDRFPHGVAGMKAAVDKIHAAGLRAGMHTLTGCISPHDAWSSPVPDPRLARDARLTLDAVPRRKNLHRSHAGAAGWHWMSSGLTPAGAMYSALTTN